MTQYYSCKRKLLRLRLGVWGALSCRCSGMNLCKFICTRVLFSDALEFLQSMIWNDARPSTLQGKNDADRILGFKFTLMASDIEKMHKPFKVLHWTEIHVYCSAAFICTHLSFNYSLANTEQRDFQLYISTGLFTAHSFLTMSVITAAHTVQRAQARQDQRAINSKRFHSALCTCANGCSRLTCWQYIHSLEAGFWAKWNETCGRGTSSLTMCISLNH